MLGAYAGEPARPVLSLRRGQQAGMYLRSHSLRLDACPGGVGGCGAYAGGADTHGWIFQYVRRPIIPCRGFPVGKNALAMIPSRHELSLLDFHKVFATLPGN